MLPLARIGTVRALGDNLQLINSMVDCGREGKEYLFGSHAIVPEVLMCTDVAALRHCEHLANSVNAAAQHHRGAV